MSNATKYTQEKAANAILRAASRNSRITAAGLLDECERGDFGGWMSVPACRACNASELSGALTLAADALARAAIAKATGESK